MVVMATAGFFELTGDASITYDFRTEELSYVGPSRPPLRDAYEIREVAPAVATPVGRLVTGTIRSAEDGDSNAITVLLPDVNLGDPAEEVAFETLGIWTTIRSSIGGPGLVEGAVQHYVHRPLSGIARPGSGGASRLTAVLTRELPGPGVLQVEGVCTFDSSGYTVDLVRHEPQGVNPEDLLLDLVAVPPEMGNPTITDYPVSYGEVTETYYRTVTVLPAGPTVEVEIIT
jgi:hypothetical protein